MKKLAIGVDIGGTHVTAGIVDLNKHKLIKNTIVRIDTDSAGDLSSIMSIWVTVIQQCLATTKENVAGIGIAMPGPFDYENGISEILGVGKYDSLFGLNVRYALADRLKTTQPHYIRFMNDAHCFLAGETWQAEITNRSVIGLTLGTGIGPAFWKNNKIKALGWLHIWGIPGSLCIEYQIIIPDVTHIRLLHGTDQIPVNMERNSLCQKK